MTAYRELTTNPARLFVVGDIHGCIDETTTLLRFLKEKEGLSVSDQVVFIGDYVDRGPDSKGVITLLLEFRKKFPGTIFLKGNHEDMLLSYLGLPGSMGDVYLANGGDELLLSYGLERTANAAELYITMPEEHREFLQGLDRYVVSEKYIFAHAGLDPLRALPNQIDDDIFWIRDEFINNIHHFERIVVFGHTPFEDVVYHMPYKVGLDTGCVFGNKLTCLEFNTKKVYQVAKGSEEVKVGEFPG